MSNTPDVLGIRFAPKPRPEMPGHLRFTTIVTMKEGQFFQPHHHPIATRITNWSFRRYMAETEVYDWRCGSVLIWLRPSMGDRWQRIDLGQHVPFVTIPPGWHHAGYAREYSRFVAHTRVDHLRGLEDGGNVHPVSRRQWPRTLTVLTPPYTIYLGDIR